MEKKDTKIERRFYELPVKIETRDGNTESRTVVGSAAVFDKWSNPMGGWFREKIDRHAFDNVLDQDTVALFNHDTNLILARNSAKTLKLSVDDKVLRYEFEAPNTTAGNDLLENIRNGNISSSSFAFTVKTEQWSKSDSPDLEEDRTIIEVDQLIDVSPVVFPAYPDTSVAKRSFDAFQKENNPKSSDLELRKAKLSLSKHSI